MASRPGEFRLLNDPDKALRRLDLLQTLHARGRNAFRAVRVTDPLDGLRYPVFVRQELDHTGSLTPLLRDRAELDVALHRLRRWWLSGIDPRTLLVIEFVDTWVPIPGAGDDRAERRAEFRRTTVVRRRSRRRVQRLRP